jgi:hypothetical protein
MVSICKKGGYWKNKAGVHTGEQPDYGFGMDKKSFIKPGKTWAAKVVANNRYRQVSGRYLFT